MGDTTDIRKGVAIEMDGNTYMVVDFQHIKPGKGNAFVRTKLKNIETGAVIEKNIKVGTQLNIIRVEERPYQYLYNDGNDYYFMSLENYEQISVPKEIIGDAVYYLLDNMDVELVFADERVVGVNVPTFVNLRIVETDPGVKGNTAQGGSKPAILETGLKINVPLFIQEGELVKVDTRTGEYVERAKE